MTRANNSRGSSIGGQAVLHPLCLGCLQSCEWLSRDEGTGPSGMLDQMAQHHMPAATGEPRSREVFSRKFSRQTLEECIHRTL